ncbi:hypothetical protein BGX24_000989 [Mortierella sp. AD032]|nr:hypothetical protein BGX24_000989 [Mortierella sp. AD032]
MDICPRRTMSKESHTPTPPRSLPQPKENDGDDKSVSSQRIRKRDKFMNLFRSSSPEPKVRAKPQSSSPKIAAHRLTTTSTNASVYGIATVGSHDNIETKQAVASTAVKNHGSKPEPSTLSFNLRADIFTQNVNTPAVLVSLPEFGTRISATPQLVLCIDLLPKNGDAGEQQPNPSEILPSETAAKIAWVKAVK